MTTWRLIISGWGEAVHPVRVKAPTAADALTIATVRFSVELKEIKDISPVIRGIHSHTNGICCDVNCETWQLEEKQLLDYPTTG